jgi:hypothetical protein
MGCLALAGAGAETQQHGGQQQQPQPVGLTMADCRITCQHAMQAVGQQTGTICAKDRRQRPHTIGGACSLGVEVASGTCVGLCSANVLGKHGAVSYYCLRSPLCSAPLRTHRAAWCARHTHGDRTRTGWVASTGNGGQCGARAPVMLLH